MDVGIDIDDGSRYDSAMFSLWGKKKEPVVLGGKGIRVPGMPAGLYSSKDVENLRFHDKRRAWYDAKQVDDALDKVQATLEWWESRSGLKPEPETDAPPVGSKVDSGVEAGQGTPLDIDVSHLAEPGATDSKPVLVEWRQTGAAGAVVTPTAVKPAVPPAPPIIHRSPDAMAASKQADAKTAVKSLSQGDAAAASKQTTATATAIPAVPARPMGHKATAPARTGLSGSVLVSPTAHEDALRTLMIKPTVDADANATTASSVDTATRPTTAARTTRSDAPVPTSGLNTIAPYTIVGAGKAVDGFVKFGEPGSKKRPLEELAELAGKADDGETAHAVPSIPLPEVPSVPVIPTNPFLRRG